MVYHVHSTYMYILSILYVLCAILIYSICVCYVVNFCMTWRAIFQPLSSKGNHRPNEFVDRSRKVIADGLHRWMSRCFCSCFGNLDFVILNMVEGSNHMLHQHGYCLANGFISRCPKPQRPQTARVALMRRCTVQRPSPDNRKTSLKIVLNKSVQQVESEKKMEKKWKLTESKPAFQKYTWNQLEKKEKELRSRSARTSADSRRLSAKDSWAAWCLCVVICFSGWSCNQQQPEPDSLPKRLAELQQNTPRFSAEASSSWISTWKIDPQLIGFTLQRLVATGTETVQN